MQGGQHNAPNQKNFCYVQEVCDLFIIFQMPLCVNLQIQAIFYYLCAQNLVCFSHLKAVKGDQKAATSDAK
jgi:hypothetical protein